MNTLVKAERTHTDSHHGVFHCSIMRWLRQVAMNVYNLSIRLNGQQLLLLDEIKIRAF